ncbi:uncharacterized protein VICG_01691, partial [Vittaforma corneae ATCC 50505]
MVPEQNIAQFLENFSKSDRIHLRTYNMLYESYRDPKNLRDLISLLIDSGVNVENLSVLLENIRMMEESDKTSSHALFDKTKPIKHSFESYESPNIASVDLSKRPEPVCGNSIDTSELPLKKSKVELEAGAEELSIPGLLLDSDRDDNELKEVSAKISV